MQIKRLLILAALTLFVGRLIASAQDQISLQQALRLSSDQMGKLRNEIKSLADDQATAIVNAQKEGRSKDPSFGSLLAAFLTAQKAKAVVATEVETSRTDKQAGAPFSSSGSLNTVDRPGIPNLLGFGLQHGAITQNITGNTLTLSSSPYMLIAAIGRSDTAETYSNYGDTYGRLALSASFNLTDQANPLANASRKQLTQWSADLRLLGDHSGRSKNALDKFLNSPLKTTMQNLANDQAKILAVVNTLSPVTTVMLNSARTAIQGISPSATDDDRRKAISDIILNTFFQHVGEINIQEKDKDDLESAIEAYGRAVAARLPANQDFDQMLTDLQKQMSLTLEYNQQQPTTGSNYSVVKLLLEKQPSKLLQLTANLSGSFYHHPDASKNQETFRGASAALEVMQKLGRSPFLSDMADRSPITFSFSGRYERLPENSGMAKKKADIAVVGGKLEIPIAAGMSFPISVTYANSTELIKEAHVQGNFGFTFDLDKLNALIHK
jgi:hypothetical protein